MGRPCGCGDTCNCVIEGGLGIDTSGAGTTQSPWIIDFDGSEVVGPGIQWSNSQLSTKLVPGGGILYDANGAMYTTGGGGGPNDPLDLVTPLEAANPIIGGFQGAGSLIHPENLLDSYQAGIGMGLDFMHVPVRMTGNGEPVVFWDDKLGRTVYDPYDTSTAAWQAKFVHTQSDEYWRTLPQPAGMYDPLQGTVPPNGIDPTLPSAWLPARYNPMASMFGWFGYLAKPQRGGTFLQDVMAMCQNKIPLLLHLRFPPNIQQPTSLGPWQSLIFLQRVQEIILRLRMQNQVIVTCEAKNLTIPSDVGPTPVDVLAFFNQVGVRVGPVFETTADFTANPASTFAGRNWTWAVMPNSTSFISDVLPYTALGTIHTVALNVNRQWMYDAYIAATDMQGAISADPVYFAAAFPHNSHPPMDRYGYRRSVPLWQDHVISHGWFHPTADWNPTVNDIRPFKRGGLHVEPPGDDQNQLWFTTEMRNPPFGRSWWISQGWCAPLTTPTNWGMDFNWRMDNPGWTGAAGDQLLFAFGVPTDHDFADWDAGDPVQPGRMLDTGYTIGMGQDSVIRIGWYENGALQGSTTTTPLTPTQPGQAGQKRFKVCVDPRGIRLCAVEASGQWRALITLTAEPYTRFRGAYTYFGCRRTPAGTWPGRVLSCFYGAGQGTAWWDAALPRT